MRTEGAPTEGEMRAEDELWESQIQRKTPQTPGVSQNVNK